MAATADPVESPETAEAQADELFFARVDLTTTNTLGPFDGDDREIAANLTWLSFTTGYVAGDTPLPDVGGDVLVELPRPAHRYAGLLLLVTGPEEDQVVVETKRWATAEVGGGADDPEGHLTLVNSYPADFAGRKRSDNDDSNEAILPNAQSALDRFLGGLTALDEVASITIVGGEDQIDDLVAGLRKDSGYGRSTRETEDSYQLTVAKLMERAVGSARAAKRKPAIPPAEPVL
jgi:hypothetical protein